VDSSRKFGWRRGKGRLKGANDWKMRMKKKSEGFERRPLEFAGVIDQARDLHSRGALEIR
jgi:hypothetical protein